MWWKAEGVYSRSGRTVTPMTDARIEAFLAGVLALAEQIAEIRSQRNAAEQCRGAGVEGGAEQ